MEILDTGFWILDKVIKSSILSSIEHPASSIEHPAVNGEKFYSERHTVIHPKIFGPVRLRNYSKLITKTQKYENTKTQ